MNRQYFDVVFSHLIERAERNRTPLSLAIFDLDNLKIINDSHGHLEGDRAIKEVARIARAQIRGSDVIARWGGDEFTLLLPDCAAEDTRRLMETIQQRVMEAVHFTDTLELGVSAGVAEYRRGDTTATLLARADERLYAAKRESKSKGKGGEGIRLIQA